MGPLTTEFDDKRYPHNYLFRVPDIGGLGLILRLTEAAENLGFDMPMARKHVTEPDPEYGEPHFLVAVALTQRSHYQRLLDEVDRLSVEHQRGVIETLSNGQDQSHGDFLMEVYAEQVAEGEAHQVARTLLGDDVELEMLGGPERDDLMADYADWIRSDALQIQERVLDELELDL